MSALRYFPIAAALCLAMAGQSPAAYCDDTPILRMTAASGTVTKLFVRTTDLANVSPWWFGDGTPPVSMPDAAEIAKRWATAQDGAHDVEIRSVSLHPWCELEGGPRGVYLVALRWLDAAGGQSSRTVAILMDRRVIEPESAD